MSAAAVLRSQDCLRRHYGPHRQPTNFNPNHNNTTAFRSRRRKRSPTRHENSGPDRSRDANADRKSTVSDAVCPRNNLVMGQVKILKRGEALPDLGNINNKPAQASAPAPAPAPSPTTKTSKKLGSAGRRDEDELILCSTGRLGPDPETVQRQIKASDFYAGSAPIVASPHPSSLPLPAFFCKEQRKFDVATNDLLRLLRLDLS